jgi:hypothetical protein
MRADDPVRASRSMHGHSNRSCSAPGLPDFCMESVCEGGALSSMPSVLLANEPHEDGGMVMLLFLNGRLISRCMRCINRKMDEQRIRCRSDPESEPKNALEQLNEPTCDECCKGMQAHFRPSGSFTEQLNEATCHERCKSMEAHFRPSEKTKKGIMSWKRFQSCLESAKPKMNLTAGDAALPTVNTSFQAEIQSDDIIQEPAAQTQDNFHATMSLGVPYTSFHFRHAGTRTAEQDEKRGNLSLLGASTLESGELQAGYDSPQSRFTTYLSRSELLPSCAFESNAAPDIASESIIHVYEDVHEKSLRYLNQSFSSSAGNRLPSPQLFLTQRTLDPNYEGCELRIKNAIEKLQMYPDCDQTEIPGVCELYELCTQNSRNGVVAVENGAVELIVELLSRVRFLPCPAVEQALQSLCICFAACDQGRVTAGAHDGVRALLLVLEHYNLNVRIQVLGLDALAILATGIPANIYHLKNAGGIHFILATMRKFRGEIRIQRAALRLIECISAENPSSSKDFGALGGVRDVTQTLRFGGESDNTVKLACSCIRHLAFEKENRVRADDCNCIQAIVEAIENSLHSDGALEEALLAISNLTFDNDRNKWSAVKSGIISKITKVLNADKTDPELVSSACRVLRNLSDSTQNIKRLLYENGAINMVAAAMKRNIGHAEIQEHATAMLINMLNTYPRPVIPYIPKRTCN